MSGLTLADLTDAMHAFVRDKGWYEPQSPRPQTLRNLAISLSLEAAEVLEHFQWREGAPGEIDQAALSSELADVALYLLQMASIGGIDLEQAILDKLRINYGRTWDQ